MESLSEYKLKARGKFKRAQIQCGEKVLGDVDGG